MTVTNALLVRWSGGWFDVVDAGSVAAHGRHEDFFSAGNARSPEEAERLALAQLARLAEPTETVKAAVEPGPGEEPYVDVLIGDTVTIDDSTGTPTTKRVLGFTVSEDETDGAAVIVPTLE